ncbi:hypothetical protein DL768_002027 [Monosporascus sp. mg162]|nr:hypothetical protein DL768_002027 [Monosporascus sp. mg162]
MSLQERGRPTYLSEATRQLTDLSRTVELEPCAERLLTNGIKHVMQVWGDKAIPDQVPERCSFCSEDHSPVEYSVAVDYRTGAVQLRHLVEPQADEATLEAFQARALEFVSVLDQQYQDTVSLDRVKAIQDIFLPTDGEARGKFAALFSQVVSRNASAPEWKIYLDIRTRGTENVWTFVRATLTRLSMEEAYEVITQTMEPTGIPFLFALDLNPGPDSRVKVYFEHLDRMAADIAAKLAAICPETNPKEVERFLVTMSGGSPGPYRGKPAGTHLTRIGNGDILRTYQRSIDVLKKRPLEAGRGLHSWVAFKTTKMRGEVFTFYISAEPYNAMPVRERDGELWNEESNVASTKPQRGESGMVETMSALSFLVMIAASLCGLAAVAYAKMRHCGVGKLEDSLEITAASVHAWGYYGGQYDRASDIGGRPWANNDGSLRFGGVDSSDASSGDADDGFGYWTGNRNGNGFQGGRPDFPSGDAVHYREIHGILAAIAFVGLFPLGSIFVRVIPGRFAWIVHAITQTVAYIVFIGAAVLGLYLVNMIQIPPNGASLLETSAVNVHPIVGIVILALLFFQLILGLVHHAKFKRLGRRTAWTHLHLWNGRVMMTLGIVNGGLGLGLARPSSGSIAAYLVVAATVWLLVLAAAHGELRWRWGRGAEGKDGEKTEGAGRAPGRGGGRETTTATTTTTAVTSSSGNSDVGPAAGEPWRRPDTPTPPYTPGPAGPDLAVYGGPGLNNTPTGNNTMGLPMEQEKQLDRLL